MTFLPINTFSIYYAKQLNMDMGVYGKLVGFSYGASICLAYFLGVLVDRFHSLRVGIAALSLYAVSALWGMMYITDATTFGIALMAHTVLSGTYFTATASLGQALLPRSKFAQFASAGGMLTSVTTMLVGPSLGFVLDRTDHNYRLTFVAGFVLSVSAIVILLVVYRHFQQHGGLKAYVAPGDTMPPAAPMPAH
jgi:MFS family permease